MPWRDAQSVPFTRVQISAHVPASSGVYGILDGDDCLHVGESWNLRGRLLDLAGALSDSTMSLTLVFELCPDEERKHRQQALEAELVRRGNDIDRVDGPPRQGISFRVV